jgi:drug/metabolite transporter (DMT)-like permease
MSAAAVPSHGFIAAHLLGSSFFWATAFVFMKWTADDVSPLLVAASRAVIATLVIAAWLAATADSLLPRKAERVPWLVIGTLNGWLPNLLTAFAITQIPAGLAAMIQASGPLVVAAGAHLLFASERLSSRRAFGVLVGLAGMALLIGPVALPDAGVSPAGVLAMLGTMLSYSACSLYIRTVKDQDARRLAYGQQLVAGLAAALAAVVLIGPAAGPPLAAHFWTLLALGALATAVPIVFFMRLIRAAGPTAASMNSYLVPLWTVLLAVSILGESVAPREIAGGLVVLAGVALVSFGKR